MKSLTSPTAAERMMKRMTRNTGKSMKDRSLIWPEEGATSGGHRQWELSARIRMRRRRV
jgi:hypothetical protein